MECRESDVLIVGTGITGLSAAIRAAESGLSVTVITKNENLHESNTYYAQGGIVGVGAEDSPKLLADDIIQAGSALNFKEAVRAVSENGPALVDRFLLEDIKVNFDVDENGSPALTKEAAHSVRRIYHEKDHTGMAIQQALIERVNISKNICVITDYTAIDLITNSHHSTDSQQRYKKTRVIGLYALNNATGEVDIFFSGSVLLATGGVGHIYKHTTNPSIATGDGIAMAYRAGVPIINAEYVQFHPTTLFHRDIENFLISESVRGEGARLINRSGTAFMEKYHPLGDLAPRDEVSIAIAKEMDQTGARFVYLDTSFIKGLDLQTRFPQIYEKCLGVGIDIRKDPIPVVPAAHYFCGGVKVDLNGRTALEGLYSAGETACTGLHGANRLASVSLLEGLYFGHAIGSHIKEHTRFPAVKLLKSIPEWRFPRDEDEFDPALIKNDFISLQSTMWNYTGIIRTKKRLNRALSDLNYLNHRIERFYRQAALSRRLIELRNAVITGNIITRSAAMNGKTTGCHYLEDG